MSISSITVILLAVILVLSVWSIIQSDINRKDIRNDIEHTANAVHALDGAIQLNSSNLRIDLDQLSAKLESLSSDVRKSSKIAEGNDFMVIRVTVNGTSSRMTTVNGTNAERTSGFTEVRYFDRTSDVQDYISNLIDQNILITDVTTEWINATVIDNGYVSMCV